MEYSGMTLTQKLTWRDAFKNKAVAVSLPYNFCQPSLGYKVFWYLYSADIWFGNFPLLKFLVGCNVVVWLILFLTSK